MHTCHCRQYPFVPSRSRHSRAVKLKLLALLSTDNGEEGMKSQLRAVN